VWIVNHGIVVGQPKPAEARFVKYVKPCPTPPAITCLARQLTPQRVPEAVVVERRYVVWLP
jgi:hypothetical protein